MSITKTADKVEFDIDSETLIRSIAFIEDMIEFCKEQTEEGAKEPAEALTCASEVMQAFWCEHFGDEGDKS